MKLMGRTGCHADQEFELNAGKYRIGRASTNNLQILSPYVSKFHAEISVKPDGKAWIKDLNSTNGTFIGKNRITKEVMLNNGDVIIIGKNDSYQVVIDALENEAHPESPTEVRMKSSMKPTDKPAVPALTDETKHRQIEKPLIDRADDSWFNLMDISSEIGEKIDFQNSAIETESLSNSDIDWPDVVRLKIAHDLYEKLLEGSKILLQCYDEFQVFEKAAIIIERIVPFKNGIIAFQNRPDSDNRFDYHYLYEKDIDLLDEADEIHNHNKHETAAQLLPFKNRFNSILYKSLKANTQIVGFIFICCEVMHVGFTKNDALAFEQLCKLFEAALGKFVVK